ncbi:MAG: M48 family metalloprotease [Phycisphaerae bacterium]|nr:M48 family metalloprotease [Phycisphaerae bacterium]
MLPFIENLNRFGQWLVARMWQMSIELTILAAVVLLVIYLLRIKSPTIRHAFCCLILAKPVATFLITSPVSIYGLLSPAVDRAAPPAILVPADGAGRGASQAYRRPMMPYDYPKRMPVSPESAPVPFWRQIHETVDRSGIVACIWLVLALALGLRLVFGFAYVAFLRQTAAPQRDGPVAELVPSVSSALRLRTPVTVAATDVAHGPVLAGIMRPVILLPRRLIAELTPQQMRYVIAHELVHVRRRDNLVLLIQRLAEMCFFFHPVVWLCGWIMRREAEAACDDAVLAAYAAPAEYADSLTRVAEMKCGFTRRLLVNTFAAAESNFARRVRRILRGRAARGTIWLSVASVVAMVGVALLGLPAASESKKTDSTKKDSDMTTKSEPENAAVKRDGDKVWIDGVPTLGWGKGKECTFAGALESALTATEHPYGYADIMGLTGLAFRVRWYRGRTGQRWCPSSPVGEFPEEISAIQNATGWRFHLENQLGQTTPNMEPFAPAIKDAIDAGTPVLAYGTKLNMATVYGYEAGGQTFLLRDYVQGESPLRLHRSKIGPMLIFLREHVSPMDRREALVEALSTAARNWRREAVQSEKGEYLYGDAALAAWVDDLGKADGIKQDERENLFFVSWWNYNCLADVRRAAGVFLKDGAALLQEEGAESLKRAASLYEKESELLGAVFGRKDAFLGPWSGKTIQDWSAPARKREQEILSEARKIEAAAIAEIEKALTLEGIDVVAPTPVQGSSAHGN